MNSQVVETVTFSIFQGESSGSASRFPSGQGPNRQQPFGVSFKSQIPEWFAVSFDDRVSGSLELKRRRLVQSAADVPKREEGAEKRRVALGRRAYPERARNLDP